MTDKGFNHLLVLQIGSRRVTRSNERSVKNDERVPAERGAGQGRGVLPARPLVAGRGHVALVEAGEAHQFRKFIGHAVLFA